MAAASRILLALAPLMASATPYPVPPRRTPVQIRLINEREAEARAASAAARQQVLDFFGSQMFKDAVSDCCPDAAAMSPEALLQRFREEVWAAEYAHVFPVKGGGAVTGSSSTTIKYGEEYKFLLNGYQSKLAGNASAVGAPPPHPAPPNVGLIAEEQIFGLPPFANESSPTWEEAADRLIYVAQNLRRINNGNVPIFGQATLIFDNDYIKDMVLTAPTDTGLWEFFCNESIKAPMPERINLKCDDYKPNETVVGTWDHFDHLILQNLNVWRTSEFKNRTTLAEEVKGLFTRSGFNDDYLGLPNLTRYDSQKYWEANVVGNVRLPEGVRFAIGNFAQLFGTKEGRELQQFAKTFDWPLVWAFTEFMEDGNPAMKDNRTFHLTGRLVDPTMPGSKALNATFEQGMPAHFETLWGEVAVARAANSTTPGKFSNWWHALYSSQVPVAPSTARLCGSSQKCIGFDVRTETCVCRQSSVIII